MRLDLITNPDSQRIKKLGNLSRRSFRNKQGLTLVEGPGAVTELLKSCPELALDVFYVARDDFKAPSPEQLADLTYLATGAAFPADTISARSTSKSAADPAIREGSGNASPDFSPATADLRAELNHFFQAGSPALTQILELAFKHNAALKLRSKSLPQPAPKPIWIHPLSAKIAATVAPAAQGIFALAQQVSTPPLSAIELDLSQDFILLLPQTQDPGNLGTLIRIADACGVSRVVLNKGCCDPHSPKVIRASAGSYFHLPIHYGDDFNTSIEILRAQGQKLLGADVYQALELEEYITQYQLRPRGTTWAFGNEAHGFTPAELALLDQCIKLPMWGKAESLNVSSAAAIILHRCATLGYQNLSR